MKLEYIFYIIGIIFIFIAVGYFSKNYLMSLTNGLKLLILILSTLATFIIAELLRGADI